MRDRCVRRSLAHLLHLDPPEGSPDSLGGVMRRSVQLAKGFALDIPSGYGSQESGARSQKGARVRVQQTTDFFKQVHQVLGLAVVEILRQDEKIAALLYRSFGHIEEPRFFRLAPLGETFGDIGGDRDSSPTHLQG